MAFFAAEGFRCDGVRTERRTVVNRASGVAMNRLWVQACFTYTGPALPTLGSQPFIDPVSTRTHSPTKPRRL